MKKTTVKLISRSFIIILLSILSWMFLGMQISRFSATSNIITQPLILILFFIGIFSTLFIGHVNKIIREVSEWISFIVLSGFIVIFVFGFFLLPSNVNQSSMYPTLESGDRILIYHFNYMPKKEDIVVVEMDAEVYPNIPDNVLEGNPIVYYVKRLKALPGDTITFEKTQPNSENYYILINGDYVLSPTSFQYTLTDVQRLALLEQLEENVVPEGMYFVLGDNAVASLDSRAFGLIYEEDIMGKVVYGLWPFGSIS